MRKSQWYTSIVTVFFVAVLFLSQMGIAFAEKLDGFSIQGVNYNAKNPKDSSVILQDNLTPGNPQKTYRVGDSINGFQIISISPNDMTLSGQRKLFSVNLKTGDAQTIASKSSLTPEEMAVISSMPNGHLIDPNDLSKTTRGVSISPDGRAMTQRDYDMRSAALTEYMGKDAADLQMLYEGGSLSPYYGDKKAIGELIKRVESNWH